MCVRLIICHEYHITEQLNAIAKFLPLTLPIWMEEKIHDLVKLWLEKPLIMS